jgi:hypothetical protein
MPLFEGVDKSVKLNLFETKLLKKGVVILYYAPAQE